VRFGLDGQPRAGTGGLSKLSDLEPREPVQRYEHKEPGDLLHIDTKKLGRIERPSHRVTGNRKQRIERWPTTLLSRMQSRFGEAGPQEISINSVASRSLSKRPSSGSSTSTTRLLDIIEDLT